MKRLAALITALILSTAGLSACSQNNSQPGTTQLETTQPGTQAITEPEKLLPDLPGDVDFGGYEFRFLHWEIASWGDNFKSRDLYAESETGEIINDAVYKRNRYIEEKYNIKISLITQDIGVLGNTIKTSVMAEDNAFDVVYARGFEASTGLLTAGYFADLNTVPHLDFDKPWWDQNAVKGLSVGGKLFLVASDINIMDKNATTAMVFNKQLAIDYSVPNLYQLVKDNQWTFDKFIEIMKLVTKDLNGDGAMDQNDLYGFIGEDSVAPTFMHAGGGRFASKDENDLPVIAFGNERTFSVCSKIFDIIYDKDHYFSKDTLKSDQDNTTLKMFTSNQGLFRWTPLVNMPSLRQMEVDFGILPLPKFDSAQENYGHTVSIHSTGFISVPISAPDIERTGIILEALSAESMYTVIPAYYDVTLKTKFARDDESSDMLDIIFSTRVFDLGEIYGFGGMNEALLRIASTKNRDIASLFEKKETAMQKDIDKLIEKVQAME